MAVPTPPRSLTPAVPGAWWVETQAGVVGSLAMLAVVVTLGLLAYAPLGAAAPSAGLSAAFVTSVMGGLVYAFAGRSAMPASGPSSATALILAALVLELANGTARGGRVDVALVVAGCGAAVALSGLLQVALARLGRRDAAHQALLALARVIALGDWRFTEWLHGRTLAPMGMAGQSWNAATFLLALRALRDEGSGW